MAMTGAMSAAISGLKTHMDALNVVGNNIANVNTPGYKAQRVTFKESIYNTLSAGSGGTNVMGGTNPQQIGYGCSIGTIDLDMTTGTLDPTGRPMDCAIKGDGFFLVGPKTGMNIDSADSLNGLTLTRVGNFDFRDGYLVDGQGNVVYGFLTSNLNDPTAGGDAGTNVGGVSTHLVPIRLPMKSTADGTEGDAVYVGVDAATGQNVDPTTDVDGFIQFEDMSIDANGKITCTNKDTGDPVVVGYIALGSVENPSGVLHTDGPYYTAGDAAGSITLSTPNSALTGYLNNGKIEENGEVDPSTKLAAGSGVGILTSFLEQSGTDLATEFSNMIIYQRGYQANTRIVTVTDSMLEELVNIKR
jgi:flagellar hook protein FlgE